MRFDAVQQPKVLTGKAPTRKIKQPDGTVLIEKLNPMRLKRKAVDQSGFISEISLANGWQQTNPRSDYALSTWDEKLKRGWLPYNECPIANGMLPAAKGDKACTGKFTDDECCPHMDKVIKARQAAHAKKQEEFASSMSTNQDRMIKVLEKQAELAVATAEASTNGKTPF
jgi:hypothetical protein